MRAVQQALDIEQRLRDRRRLRLIDRCARARGKLAAERGKCVAFGPVALQRPGSDREQHLQDAAGEDQDRRVERQARRVRLGGRDHQQDHAGEAGSPGIRAERDEHSAGDAPDESGDRKPQRAPADDAADER